MATLRDSVFYDKRFVKKYIGDPREGWGKVVPLPFEVTVVSVAATADTYNLQVIPKGSRVIGLFCGGSGIGASAGAGRTFQIGDSGDDDRYMKATDMDVVDAVGTLAYAGNGYTPTADTIVVGKFTNTPVVGSVVKGCILTVPEQ